MHSPVDPIALMVDPFAFGSPSEIDFALVKQYLRISFTDTDAVLELMMAAAIEGFENATHRTVFSRAHRWSLRDFPRGADTRIRLPRGVTRSVQKIDYASAPGVITSLYGATSAISPAGADYTEDLTDDDGGIIQCASGWPSIDTDAVVPVTIYFTAGWIPEDLPKNVLLALMYGTQCAYDDQRGGLAPDQQLKSQLALSLMQSPYTLSRWY